VKLIRDMNVVYTPITSTATPLLPFGGSGAWICGDRAFAWKVYTADESSASALFEKRHQSIRLSQIKGETMTIETDIMALRARVART